MPNLEYEEAVKGLIEEVNRYKNSWMPEIDEEDIEEDEKFLYLEIESSEDILEQFQELGNYIDARSTGEVNNGEKYILSVEKEKLA